MIFKYLRVTAALCATILATGGILEARDKGGKLYKEAQIAAEKMDWDRALDLFQQAYDLNPSNTAYAIGMRRARFEAGQRHVNLGQKLRADGKLEEAMAEFQKAVIADPSSAIAIQEMKRVQEMMKTGPAPGASNRGQTPAERARQESQDRVASIMSPPELTPVVRQVGPLKMNNQPPKVLFETVGKLAGVNVLFDSQYSPQGRNFNVELNMSTPDQAFDYLALLTHTFWKPITSNTIFVTEDNPTKHRDYDDEVVRTFYLTNVTSVQEFQEVATAIRTLTDIRRVFTYNAQKAMVVRGTLDAVGLAEKLVHDLDKPKSEVVVDVIVMQANSTRTRDLAATIASLNSSGGLTAGLRAPVSFTPRNGLTIGGSDNGGDTSGGGTSTTAIRLGQIPHLGINDFSTSLPGALLNLLMTDTTTKVLNSPQVRASDGQKASLKIGSRIPYATGSFQPGVGTVGVSPLVSTQFNYADVGVNLEITPQVHSADELTLHLEVEVSSVAQYIDLGGIQQPVIGQNKNVADIRLREGEVNILGGLSSMSDASTLNGLPGLTDIPVLGKFLFGNSTNNKSSSELLIALIPHIVRTPDYTEENLRGVYAGNDQTIKLNYAPRPDGPAALPVPVQPAGPKPTAPQAPPPPPAGQARILFSPATIQASVSSPVTVSVQVDNATDLAALSPIRIKFDPAQLRLNDISPGDLFLRDGGRVSSVKDIRNDTGEATLTVSRLPGTGGVSGSGAVATLSFVAVGKGSSSISVTESDLKNSLEQPIAVTPGELAVTVQ
jgi:general secretion pathway protein D